MTTHTRAVRGHDVPTFFYGTAWKEERTEGLVCDAIRAGFRGIDTANQRKHYDEASVGRGIARALGEGWVRREELFLQTKFTYQRGQDARLPYDPRAPWGEQVAQSHASSLQHLGVSALDSLVLHGPLEDHGWAEADRQVWAAMEKIYAAGGTRLLGVSNVSAEQLRALVKAAQVAPAFVQNRCYARHGWDGEVRAVCAQHDMVYQGFSLLTANRTELARPAVAEIARARKVTIEQVVFAFALRVGMLPLTGTTRVAHMEKDLAARDIVLTPREVETLALS